MVLLGAIILGVYLIRRTLRPNNVAHTHLRLQSDTGISNNMSMANMSSPAGYTSLSTTIRTHVTSIRSFPFFSSGGSSVSHSVSQKSPPPVQMQRDETAVEPFRLAPSYNYNPDRKQADGAFHVYDPPIAPPSMRVEVRSTTPTPKGRTKHNPPAYTEASNPSPEAGGSSSSRRSPPRVGQVHAKPGSANTQQTFTSGGNPSRGNVVNHLAPHGTVNPQMNSHGANANTSLTALTRHGGQVSRDTNSGMDRKYRPDTDDNFNVRDIA